MPGNSLNSAGVRVAPQRMGAPFPLEVTAMPPQGVGGGCSVSLDNDRFTYGVWGEAPHSILSPVFKDEGDGLC